MNQPNILFIMADQLAPHFTATYGHPLIKTPNLDALAERGARFDATYAHSPLCAPARFTMLAGRTVTDIDAWDNAAEFPATNPTLAHYLRLLGYRTTLSGKMHFVGPDQLHGFDERLTTDIYPADFAWTPNWDKAHERIDKWYHGMDTLHEAGQAAATYQIDYDGEVGYAAKRKLYDVARDADPRPFFLCASFIHPHDPYVARPEWWDLYDHDDIDLPDVPNLDTVDPHTKRIRSAIQADTIGYSEAEVRNSRHGYYANVSYFDDWIGQLVRVLEETDQLDNTVVIVTSDHGDMLGDRGAWFKMSFHERSARVPLVMAGPGVAAGTTVVNASTHLDYLPTLLDIASEGATPEGGRWPELGVELAGRSLWESATGGVDPIDEAIGEYTAEMTSRPMFMIRRGNYKYIACDTDPPQLYDVIADPLERTNLAVPGDGNERHVAVAAEFAAEVAERWDADAITERVLASQRSRRVLHRAMSSGELVSWDHAPHQDVANVYVRNHMDWDQAGPRSRYPRVGA